MSIFSTLVSKIFGRADAKTPGTMEGSSSGMDVNAILSDLANKKGGGASNWKTSIVDLMKLLDMDSSLEARKQLAKELGYTGDMNDSASMNIWLSKQVMQKLSENGGKLPDSFMK
ncbi:DUF3597 domain-containing protein [Candidatus Kirkpatrickella diaphorinae]|uniref:DUF3597 domain-containing protein n=1 Tax=Candidatus Kirkpatrickella diaphorinae TaxID=2984322 RepID=A0ABY6GKI9_9PROT|nr:DUF3597 domain-containing protein [Candidatus Kirkpatrickella diaphorinae]UYH51323.1 DUF3597 domain-containing protein [Candidatus Kirkpatrickella diaphorinae]